MEEIEIAKCGFYLPEESRYEYLLNLSEEEKICTLCGEYKHCKSGSKDCGCNNTAIPKELIDMIPEEKKRKACICEKCVEKYIEENKTI